MSEQAAIKSLLTHAFDDFILSNQEKQLLQLRLDKLDDPELLNFTRNCAFSLAKDRINQAPEQQLQVLKWLERLMKTLDGLRAPSSTTLAPSAYFSPGDQCREKIISLCSEAKRSIKVCVFTLSDDRISNALLQAHGRGVEVLIISDNLKADDRGSDIYHLQQQGVPVKMDTSANHMHHKFALFDDNSLINGSFNWTRSASRYNQENIVVHHDQRLIGQFLKEFERLWQAF